jgi:cytochrome b
VSGGDAMVRVWDPLVRVMHWALVATVLLSWVTKEGGGKWHEWLGYAATALVVVRIAWGVIGSRYARFSQFVRTPRVTLRYGARVLRGRAPRYIGHNPLGGWMTLALLIAVALTGLTGWLYTTPEYWGVEWMEDTHEATAVAVLLLAAAHVAGVIATSLAHRENLSAAMIHGYKRTARADDVD